MNLVNLVDLDALNQDFLGDGMSPVKARAAVQRIVGGYLKMHKHVAERDCPKCGVPSTVFRNSTCLECDRARIRRQAEVRRARRG